MLARGRARLSLYSGRGGRSHFSTSSISFQPTAALWQRWSGLRVDGTEDPDPNDSDYESDGEEPNADAGADVQNRHHHHDEIVGFAINGLNRFHAHHLRRDDEWLRYALHESPNSRFLAFHKLRPMVEHRTPPTHLGPILAWQERGEVLPAITDAKSTVLLLGQSLRETNSDRSIQEQLSDESNQINVFAFDLDPIVGDDEQEAQRYAAAHQTHLEVRTTFEEPRAIVPHLPPWEGGVVAQARSLLHWHKKNGFCAACGSTTKSVEAGYVRKCNDDKNASCGMDHYPRTDPCIITMVVSSNRDKCLLGRKSSWPAGRFSLLAGFMEPGETIEAAVLREVYEEAGLLLDYDKVAYKLSQPWPFPASLMIGCVATMHEAEIQRQKVSVDYHELDEARWFDVKEVAAMLARSTQLTIGIRAGRGAGG
ncbi:hydrolase, NUDIX, putative [Acanthamoeba castellanii str. Neff]|uniref:NAD(+) diphosphatase n=1 Tax=Acanthamoeba castellanii (strain ATCC 30010 / Neff) TaxID=1257118 RepID=L8HFZ1_ACACF|nr:hydrolase, NUDIX, putative [Acanthamoeba castellanii str. Neff]ELR24060.1 hydrolase, NUDIX, putative [Acanthamoeba castellanii str. Neff]